MQFYFVFLYFSKSTFIVDYLHSCYVYIIFIIKIKSIFINKLVTFSKSYHHKLRVYKNCGKNIKKAKIYYYYYLKIC